MREDVRASLEHANSKVSITLDFWTSYEQVYYMSVKCHWIDDNCSLHKILLDVCHIPYPCAGSEILRSLMKALTAFNIETKILSCTTDNNQHAIHACYALKDELDAISPVLLNQIIEDGLRTPKSILSKIQEFVLELNMYPDDDDDGEKMQRMQMTTWIRRYELVHVPDSDRGRKKHFGDNFLRERQRGGDRFE